jgi:hypothetical protein
MHRESQVVKVETDYGPALAFHCLVQYFIGSETESDYFEHDDIEVIGEIGYEEE